MPSPSDTTQRYFDAWNAHDSTAISACFSEAGFYEDPNGRFDPTALATYAEGLWSAFPDLRFELVSEDSIGDERVAAQWLMTGTNHGSFQGLPPSGKSISLPGADFIRVSDDGIDEVRGYFDTRALPQQLGLQVLVQPDSIGPFSFGYSVTVQSGNRSKPGAFSITSIWNASEETEEIKTLSRQIAQEMLGMEGFIGLTLARAGDRGMTISAWEKPENIRQIMHSPSHGKAMSRFWDDLSDAAFTSVWVPHHINPLWVRCKSCGKMGDPEKSAGACACGATLPDAPAYF
jgi:steroid delta-isomerase-like uncharacterized protein